VAWVRSNSSVSAELQHSTMAWCEDEVHMQKRSGQHNACTGCDRGVIVAHIEVASITWSRNSRRHLGAYVRRFATCIRTHLVIHLSRRTASRINSRCICITRGTTNRCIDHEHFDTSITSTSNRAPPHCRPGTSSSKRTLKNRDILRPDNSPAPCTDEREKPCSKIRMHHTKPIFFLFLFILWALSTLSRRSSTSKGLDIIFLHLLLLFFISLGVQWESVGRSFAT